MKSNRKKQVHHESFESTTSTGRFIKICSDMINSPAWKSLKMSQRALYIELKSKFTRSKDGTNNKNNISLPKAEALILYGDLRTFRADLDKVIEVGLIKCISSGWTTRTASIYGFSDSWKNYGKPGFTIPHGDLRPKRTKHCDNCS